MFKYTNTITGESMIVENPRFVQKNEAGIWVRCSAEDAECVAIDGERFSIANKPPVDDAPQSLAVSQVDAGTSFNKILADALSQAQDIDELKAALVDVMDAMVDIYENGI